MDTVKIVTNLNTFSQTDRYGYIKQSDRVVRVSLLPDQTDAEILSPERAFNDLKEILQTAHQKLGVATIAMIEDKSAGNTGNGVKADG